MVTLVDAGSMHVEYAITGGEGRLIDYGVIPLWEGTNDAVGLLLRSADNGHIVIFGYADEETETGK